MKDYGYRKTNPDYWQQMSAAIWGDPALTRDDQFAAQKELIDSYYSEKRDKSAREKSKQGPSNLDPDNPEIQKAEKYAKSIQNPKYKKHK